MEHTKRLIRQVQAVREGGHVQRCHCIPVIGDASNARHQWNAATMYLLLCPSPRLEVVKHLLLHDVAERWTGDVPATAKLANPGLTEHLHQAERMVETMLGIVTTVPPEEALWVKALDVLELFMFCHDQLAMGNRNFAPTLGNCERILASEWVPAQVRHFAAQYEWSRTTDIVPGEVIDAMPRP